MTIDVAAFNADITAGDKSLTANAYGAAVSAYQRAGNTGATVVGPSIDAASNGASMPQTHAAWVLNGTLAQVNNGPTAGATDAAQAKTLIGQMLAQYRAAIAAIPNSTATVGPAIRMPTGVPSLPLVTGGLGLALGLVAGGLVPALVVGAVGAGIGFLFRKQVTS
jgi:hypothetical protein